MGLLHSRSTSQGRFKMLVNDCPDDIFWMTEHFVSKLGMVMQHHEPECHLEKLGGGGVKVKITARTRIIKIWLSPLWTVESLAATLGLMIHHLKPECIVKFFFYCIQGQGHSQGSKWQCLSRWYLLNHQTFFFPNLGLLCIIMSWSVLQKDLLAVFKVKVTARVS